MWQRRALGERVAAVAEVRLVLGGREGAVEIRVNQEIEASDTTSLYTTSTSKVEAADRTNELKSRQTKVKLLTPPAKLRRRKSGADLTP